MSVWLLELKWRTPWLSGHRAAVKGSVVRAQSTDQMMHGFAAVNAPESRLVLSEGCRSEESLTTSVPSVTQSLKESPVKRSEPSTPVERREPNERVCDRSFPSPCFSDPSPCPGRGEGEGSIHKLMLCYRPLIDDDHGAIFQCVIQSEPSDPSPCQRLSSFSVFRKSRARQCSSVLLARAPRSRKATASVRERIKVRVLVSRARGAHVACAIPRAAFGINHGKPLKGLTLPTIKQMRASPVNTAKLQIPLPVQGEGKRAWRARVRAASTSDVVLPPSH